MRKEFFQVDLQWIIDLVRQKHGTIDYVAEPEALQYRETQQIIPEELVKLEEDLESLGVDFEEADEQGSLGKSIARHAGEGYDNSRTWREGIRLTWKTQTKVPTCL